GGGSAIALAKAVALLLRNPAPLLDYAGRDRAPTPPAPCVAVPATAGSGSEVSNALVLHDPALESIVVVRGRGYEPVAANLACGPAGLGLVHALSSAAAVHLPHGYQNGVLLPHVAAFNLPAVEPAVAAEIERLPALYERIGFAASFAPGQLDGGQATSMI